MKTHHDKVEVYWVLSPLVLLVIWKMHCQGHANVDSIDDKVSINESNSVVKIAVPAVIHECLVSFACEILFCFLS